MRSRDQSHNPQDRPREERVHCRRPGRHASDGQGLQGAGFEGEIGRGESRQYIWPGENAGEQGERGEQIGNRWRERIGFCGSGCQAGGGRHWEMIIHEMGRDYRTTIIANLFLGVGAEERGVLP